MQFKNIHVTRGVRVLRPYRRLHHWDRWGGRRARPGTLQLYRDESTRHPLRRVPIEKRSLYKVGRQLFVSTSHSSLGTGRRWRRARRSRIASLKWRYVSHGFPATTNFDCSLSRFCRYSKSPLYQSRTASAPSCDAIVKPRAYSNSLIWRTSSSNGLPVNLSKRALRCSSDRCSTQPLSRSCCLMNHRKVCFWTSVAPFALCVSAMARSFAFAGSAKTSEISESRIAKLVFDTAACSKPAFEDERKTLRRRSQRWMSSRARNTCKWSSSNRLSQLLRCRSKRRQRVHQYQGEELQG